MSKKWRRRLLRYLDQELKSYDQVIFDETTYLSAARYLLELGHREIGLYIPARGAHEHALPLFVALGRIRSHDTCEWIFLG
jgi:hypothetical protein